jgi:hypothetical protein
MVEMFIIAGICSFLAAIIGALIALGIQRGSLDKIHARNQAWERAQETHQHNWEIKQEKHTAELEMRLARRVQQVQKVWEEWEVKDQQRLKALAKQYEDRAEQLRLEHELARLPHIEDAPLILDATHQHQNRLPNWQPPMLQGSNLSERDLSHRYLGHADLRNTYLANANFYMSDLSGAFLTGADLSGADLSGANLAGADLRDTTLTSANFLIADLHSAILVGTNLLGARNLTTEQLDSAITEVATTQPKLQAVQPVMPLSPLVTPVAANPPQVMSTVTTVAANESAFVAPPETPLPPMLTGEAESFIPPLAEPLLSSSPVTSDSLEDTGTEIFDTATHRPSRNGKKQVKAS